MHGGRLGEKRLKIVMLAELLLQPFLVIARQPADDVVDLVFGAILALRLLHIERIDFGEFHGENPMLRHRHRPYFAARTMRRTSLTVIWACVSSQSRNLCTCGRSKASRRKRAWNAWLVQIPALAGNGRQISPSSTLPAISAKPQIINPASEATASSPGPMR